ncbi:hypothetical protein BHM03_00055472 [Ensete ventricosum]|nr:hypothetical protein BHM03_00055472 [Ensete ventricosum]
MDAREAFIIDAAAAMMWPRDVNQEATKHLLQQTASAMIMLAANGFLSAAFRAEEDLCYVLHHLVFCLVGLAASALLFLSFSVHKFPTAARRASAMAAAVVRLRRHPRRVFAFWLVLLGRDAASLCCSVWFMAAFVYVVNPCTLCYNGMVWCALFFSI